MNEPTPEDIAFLRTRQDEHFKTHGFSRLPSLMRRGLRRIARETDEWRHVAASLHHPMPPTNFHNFFISPENTPQIPPKSSGRISTPNRQNRARNHLKVRLRHRARHRAATGGAERSTGRRDMWPLRSIIPCHRQNFIIFL